MKKSLLAVCIILSVSSADEIARINALASEVKKLRVGYDACMEELQLIQNRKIASKTSEVQKSKLRTLEEKIALLDANNTHLKEENRLLRKELEKLRKIKAIMEKDLENQKKSALQREMKEEKNPQVVVVQKSDAQHLVLKDSKVKILKEVKIHTTKPKTFRTLHEASIYDAPNKNMIAKWEKGKSFTSYIEAGDWIKITGYFINRKWVPAQKELWIRKSDAFER